VIGHSHRRPAWASSRHQINNEQVAEKGAYGLVTGANGSRLAGLTLRLETAHDLLADDSRRSAADTRAVVESKPRRPWRLPSREAFPIPPFARGP